MDYKKKYKELVEILNKANEDNETKYKTFSCVFDDIMSKIRMNEDERIGDEIIDFITTTHDTRLVGNGKHVDEWVSWIEEQRGKDKLIEELGAWKVKYIQEVLSEKTKDEIEKQNKNKHKFNIGDIISNGNVTYRVDNIVKNCIGQDCYFLVNVESEKDGTRYLLITDSRGKTSHMGEISWLCEQVDAKFEKQDEPLENYDEAEKEKADFVGDGFIECHADFLDFKEGNTYWLEYIGDDMYNVRSDNLLGKTYHITPCQLYTIFKKLTWLEKQGNATIKWEKNTKDNKPQFNHPVLFMTKFDVVAEGEWNGKEWLQYRWACGIDDSAVTGWMETSVLKKQGEQKETLCDKCRREQPSHSCQDITALGRCAVEHKQKPTDNIGSKFHEGDWVVRGQFVTQIREIASDGYVNSNNGFILFDDAKYYHLWTIRDAKNGDILYSKSHNLLWIYKNDKESYCCVNLNYAKDNVSIGSFIVIPSDTCPATMEQRDLFFSYVKQTGYEWDTQKKELKKIEQEELSDFEKSLKHIIEEAIEDGDTHNLKADAELLLGLVQKPSDEEMKELLRTEYEKGRADVFAQMQKEWSEEDELQMQGIIDLLPGLTIRHNWLKCIKQRLIWKPSEEQIKILDEVLNYAANHESSYWHDYILGTLNGLIRDLKKLKA